jgi:IclR family pca regulon transcriptional regulator
MGDAGTGGSGSRERAARGAAAGGANGAVPRLREARFSQSLERGLAVLACFSAQRPVLGIADLADTLGMSRSTTHRYAATLVELGYLEQDRSRKYRLGLRVADLGLAALGSTGLRDRARSSLAALRREVNLTVNLVVLDGTEVVSVDRVRGSRPGQHRVDADTRVGVRLPAHCTSTGKVLLAYLPADEREEIVQRIEFEPRGPKTIRSRRTLRDQIAAAREAGIGLNDEELGPDMQAIAAPVHGDDGQVIAAINLVSSRSSLSLDELRHSLAPRLLAGAERLSRRLGYREAA